MKPGKRKGFALLLDAGDKSDAGSPLGTKKRPNDAPIKPPDEGDEPDGDEDLSDLDDMDMGDELPDDTGHDEPDGDEASGDAGQIDPEVAGLAARLGFHQPHEQQALIDLIQLVTGPGAGSPTSSSPSASPLPESSY